MKIIAKTLFVYLPFALCVVVQVALLLALFTDDTGVALYAKWGFPVIIAAAVVLHFITNKKSTNGY